MLYLNKRHKLYTAIAAVILVLISGTIYINQQKSAQIVLAEDEQAEPEVQKPAEQVKAVEIDPDITVYICGAVKNPGNVTVKKDTRLGEVLSLVGGTLEKADLERINLAVKLSDEDYIYIPLKGEKVQSGQPNTSKGQPGTPKGQVNSAGEPKSTKVNINTAVQAELEKLPGVGPSTAQKIMAYRQEKGKFQKPEDLKKVTGIGDKKYEKLKDHIVAE